MKRLYAGIAAIVGWFALALQFWLLVNKEDGQSFAMHTTNFFSYFTILSNILVALTLTAAASGPSRSTLAGFFQRPGVMAGVALYISVTGLVYFFILSGVWAPTGLDRVADQLLHYVMPLLYVVFWLAFVPKGRLSVWTVPGMLLFPVVYSIYSMIRGSFVGWYPYFFLDVGEFGWGRVGINILGLTAAFAVLAMIFVLLDRALSRLPARGAPAA